MSALVRELIVLMRDRKLKAKRPSGVSDGLRLLGTTMAAAAGYFRDARVT